MTLHISDTPPPYLGCGHPGLAATDGPGQDGASLVVAGEDLRDAAVAHSGVRGNV